VSDSHSTVIAAERAEVLANRYIAVNKRRNPTAQYDEVVTGAGADNGGGGCSAARGEGGPTGLLALLGLTLIIATRRHWR